MARPCTICCHPAVERIAEHLRAGTPLRQIAGDFGLSLGSLSRHKQHLGNGITTAPLPPHTSNGTVVEQPAVHGTTVPPWRIEDMRQQATALRLAADQLRRQHRPWQEYPADSVLLSMAYLIGNMIEVLWPDDH